MQQQEENFDLVVIGGGPAGYVGAIRAAQLGMNVACIEKNNSLGGTCLNEGCIPSKALLSVSEKYEEAKNHFGNFGIEASNVTLNLIKMLNYKDRVVQDLCKGIDGLFKKNRVKRFLGVGKIISETEVAVYFANSNNIQKIKTKNILIATGSEPIFLPGIEVDEKRIISSKSAICLESIPKTMIIIGGGYIGLELGSVWRRLGSEVTIIEYADKIVPAIDNEIGKQLHKILEKQGMKFLLKTKVVDAKVWNNSVNVTLQEVDNDQSLKNITADIVLVSVGRRPYTKDLGLEAVGIKLNKSGVIDVDSNFATDVKNIYAVGDVIKGPMLAHKAEEEAIAAVEIMAGQAGHVNYNAIPSVIYTSPEVASVGLTEEELKKQEIVYKVGKFPFLANSRARTIGNIDGMVKILADARTDRILAVHIIGPDAGSLIAEVTLGIEFYGAAEDIARTCHAHPTLNESIKEAALAVAGRSINF